MAAFSGIFSVTMGYSARAMSGKFAAMTTELSSRISELSGIAAQNALDKARTTAPYATGSFRDSLAVIPYGNQGFALVTSRPDILHYLSDLNGEELRPTRAPHLVFSRPWTNGPYGAFSSMYVFPYVMAQERNPWLDEMQSQLAQDVYDTMIFNVNMITTAFQEEITL